MAVPNYQPKPPTHRLRSLWDEAKGYIERYCIRTQLDEHQVIGECLGELEVLDERGDAFRYPVSTKDEPNLKGLKRLNLQNFTQVAARISNYLTCRIDTLWCNVEDKEEMESYMRDLAGDLGAV